MTQPSSHQPQPGASGDRLDSWKEIATYLKRDVATVRRWEKREGLPVHRHHHEKLGSVYAYTAELDRWSRAREQAGPRPEVRSLSKRPVWPVAAVLSLLGLAALGYQLGDPTPIARGPSRLRLASSRQGTVVNPIAAGLQEVILDSLKSVEVEVIEQPQMTSALRALDAGDVDLAFALNLLAFHAVKTERLLGHRSSNITALTVAYGNPAQIVVRRDSDVQAITDLEGKRVSIGIAESAERFCSAILLSHFGLHVTDVSDDFAPSLANLQDGRVDAYITWRAIPTPGIAEAFATGNLRLLPLDGESVQGLRVKNPFLLPVSIPARVYDSQASSISTVSARMMLLGSRALPADLVEQILRVISDRMPDLIARHPAAAEIGVQKRPTIEEGLSIDLHPGAEQFFRTIESHRTR